jgi:hypothetical protein
MAGEAHLDKDLGRQWDANLGWERVFFKGL